MDAQFSDRICPCGTSLLNDQGEMGKGGRDMYGVNWLITADTYLSPLPGNTMGCAVSCGRLAAERAADYVGTLA